MTVRRPRSIPCTPASATAWGATVLGTTVGLVAGFKNSNVFTRATEAMQAFAGPEPDVALVEPEARAALADFDDLASCYALAHSANFA